MVKIKGFPGYSITKSGLVYNDRGKLLRPHKNYNGYLKVSLCSNGNKKNLYVHRLVADHYLKMDSRELQVDHIDSDKLNNDISNLRWVTRSVNINRSIPKRRANLSKEERSSIKELSLSGKSIREISDITNIKGCTVQWVLKNN